MDLSQMIYLWVINTNIEYRYIVGTNMEKKKKFINKIDAYVAYVRLKKIQLLTYIISHFKNTLSWTIDEWFTWRGSVLCSI